MMLRACSLGFSLKASSRHLLRRCLLCVFAFALVLYGAERVAWSATIYWGDYGWEYGSGRIYAAGTDGSNQRAVVSGWCQPRGIAVDPTGSKLYWADPNSIFSVNLDGSNIESLVTGGSAGGIALDAAHEKIYWADELHVHRSDTDGGDPESLVTSGANYNPDVALDLTHGRIYSTASSFTTPGISVANLDGSDWHTLIVGDASGIALDVAGEKIFWACGSAIKCARLDGTQIQTLVELSMTKTRGIALDLSAGKMYWTEFTGEPDTTRIRRANLDGSVVEDFVTGLSNPSFVTIAVPEPSVLTLVIAGAFTLVFGVWRRRR